MKRSTEICGLVLLLALLAAPAAWAQTDDPSPEAEETTVEEDEAEDEATADDEDEQDDEAAQEEEPEGEEPPASPAPIEEETLEAPAEEDAEEEWPEDWDEEDFEAFDDDIDFVPLDELDDAMLDRITAMARFPFVEYDGMLRVRSRARINFDLGTGGTSAMLPPLDREVGTNPDAQALWSTDLRLRLAPTFHLTETLRVHTDIDFLRNVAFGDDPRHSLFFPGVPSANQRLVGEGPPLARTVEVREAYGEVDTFLLTVQAGRMLDHWGLGMFANNGNCTDCDWGDSIGRLALRSRIWDFYVRGTYDFPEAGLVTRSPGFEFGSEQELARLDSTRQWTLSAFRSPLTREERERQAHRLTTEGLPAFNGGLYFLNRSQEGTFIAADAATPDDTGEPIYRGLNLYTLSPWVQVLWHPNQETRIRVEIEGLTTFGRIDNTTNQPVGFEEGTGEPRDVNCFDADLRANNPGACTTGPDGNPTDSAVRQFGLALESEIDLGGPVSFGINGGFATGGNAPNWGYGAPAGQQVDFTRFNPDYHVDLILFREVIGTVTNAYYANPYVVARFLDTGLQRMEFQLDAIGSRAFNTAGAPGDSPWLGLEFDGSLRFLATDAFVASLDGGILFPLGGLGAVSGQERLNAYGAPGPFVEDRSPRLAWTVQGRLVWNF